MPNKPKQDDTVELAVGDSAPEFTTTTDEGETVSLSDFEGKNIVLYFYPKDSTPGCTLESQTFTKFKNKFSKNNAIILGVSRDNVSSHQRFKDKCNLGVTLLADTDETICQAYGVIKQKMMYGKSVRGIERSTFLIDPNGKIKHVWRKVKVPGHVEDVLAVLKSSD